MTPPLILASASPFRRSLLENAGVAFSWQAASIDERAIEEGLVSAGASPEEVALRLAEAKARDVASRCEDDAVVIGSDQTLSLGSRVFHKPADRADVVLHLRSLAGQTHQLNSAVVLVRGGEVLWQHLSSARMTMRVLSEAFLERHIDRVGDTVLGSVGAYQLEGEGIQLFERIEGDYFTILGLPMLPLLEALRRIGAIDG